MVNTGRLCETEELGEGMESPCPFSILALCLSPIWLFQLYVLLQQTYDAESMGFLSSMSYSNKFIKLKEEVTGTSD